MLTILGFVAIIVFTIQVYKAAKSTERNAALWALACAVVGLGFQFGVPIAIGLVIGIYYVVTGMPMDSIEAEISGLALIIGILGLILSVVGMVLIAKHVSRVKLDRPGTNAPPPPPPTFNQTA